MSQKSNIGDKPRILFIPLLFDGHINYMVSISRRLLDLFGDKVELNFAVDEEFKAKIKKRVPNASYSVYPNTSQLSDPVQIAQMIELFGSLWTDDTLKYVQITGQQLAGMLRDLISLYPTINRIIKEIKPNLIVYDTIFSLPYGPENKIPFVNIYSMAMSYVACSPKIPPPQSGLPTKYSPENHKKWQEFVDKVYKNGPFKDFKDSNSGFLKDHNCPGLDDTYFNTKPSPYLNIYCYPKELDYQEDNIKLPGNWLRIESPVLKPIPTPFREPNNLKNLPGKLIYFSLGTMASSYKPLMEKMLEILAQLPHRFIISKGLIGDQYKLAKNMYGENYVDQISVLQIVDIVISHGGNNTLTESFAFGKPNIILPLFADQPDNAQRVEDQGLGKRLSIFDPPAKLKADLINAIKFCSQDSVISKLKNASERILKDSGIDKACHELIKLAQKK